MPHNLLRKGRASIRIGWGTEGFNLLELLVASSPSWGRLTIFAALLGLVSALRAAPAVSCENFNELGNTYQQAVNNNGLTGLPAGVTANFNWHWQLMWSPGGTPPGSSATNNVEPGWTPASPAITFNKPVVLWSVELFKKWNNTLTVIGKRTGAQVWAFTNSDSANNFWVTLTRGAGKVIDELDVNCDSWGVKFTDFRFSNATGFSPYTNVSPFYVDGANPLASDYNPGTEALPWQTLQWAANSLQPADTVYIKAGTYTGDVLPLNSGTANAWITYSAYPGQEQQGVLDHAGFYINQKSYLKVSSLRIQHSSGLGIGITGPGANFVISSNYIFDIANSGIGVWGVPWMSDPGEYHFKAITNLIVDGNTIEQACNGGYDEQISIANGVDNFEVRFNTIKNGTNNINGGEGIDCKEGASNGKVHGNHLFNLRRYSIYLDAGASPTNYYSVPALLTNIEVFSNLIDNNDAYGIGVTSEGLGNLDGIKVYNNICYSNGCDGILLYDFGYPSSENYASNITIINNTTFNNNTSTNTPWYGGIATDHHYAQNVVVRNNIAFETLQYAFGIKPPFNPATLLDHNISTTTDPGFVSTPRADFHLRSSSRAVNYGSPLGAPLFDFDGSARPYGPAFDAGAYEYHPSTPFSLWLQWPSGQPAPALSLQGGPESHYQVQWRADFDTGAWNLLLDIPSLPCSPFNFADPNTHFGAVQRLYRAVLVP